MQRERTWGTGYSRQVFVRRMLAPCVHVGNTRSEARNTKPVQNPKDQNPKLAPVDGFVLNIWILRFEFVLDFGFEN
jgi:hypothetical protein